VQNREAPVASLLRGASTPNLPRRGRIVAAVISKSSLTHVAPPRTVICVNRLYSLPNPEVPLRSRGIAGAGLGLAVVSASTFSVSGPLVRSLTDAGWTPAAAAAVRSGLAAVLLAGPAVFWMRGRWSTLRRELGSVTGFGVVAVAGSQVSYFNAVQRLPVGVALLLEYLGIVLVVGWLWLRYGQRPRRLTVVGSIVALLGLVLVLDLIGSGHIDPVGVLWALGAAVGLAAYFALSARAATTLPAVAMAGAGLGIGALTLLAVGVSGVLPIRATFDHVHLAGHRMTWLVPVLALALIASVVGYLAGIGAARLLGAKLASFAGLTEVLFAVLMAWLLLGELPTAIQFAGGGLILAGIALVRADELAPRRVPAPEPSEASPVLVAMTASKP
jgi:drug/metabolite transporter (DMT)-like permease